MLQFGWIFIGLLLGSVDGKREIPIGAIFHGDNYEAEIAFKYAIERVNMHEKHFELLPLIKYVSPEDSYKTEKKVCELASEGVTAIFGPSSILTSGIVSSICKTIEIPHIITHWDPEPIGGVDPELQAMTINLYPDADVLSRALRDLIVDYSWKSFTIIYDSDEGLMRLKDILQIHGPTDNPITVRQIDDDPDYRPLLKDIQSSGESHIILEVHPDKILEILRQAREVKMLEEYQSYIITTLDAHTLDFEELKYSRSNITTLRLMDTKTFDIKNAVHDWEQGEGRMKKVFRVSPEHVRTESALYNDAVKIYATAIRELDATEEITPSRLSCGSKNLRQWPFGLRIINYMKVKTEHGITGPIIFDDNGHRTHFQLDIIELSQQDGFKKIAIWDPTNGINYTRSEEDVRLQIVESLQNKTFIVASRLGAPFLMLKEKGEGEFLEGNNRFEGYSLELIDGISKILGFQYRMVLVPDGKYGSYNKQTKKWDGLVKHLLDRKADLAICDLTITYERRTAVDFTMPFMTLGISILYAKPVPQPKDLFSFLSPLSLDVWIYMATAYLGVSVLLFVLSRMAPADWENPHPCKQDEVEEVENVWNMLNALWLTMGSIMGQGCDILPKAVSTRVVAGMWWFFALIMLSSYTANLAAFLTMERMDASIESAEDLAKQSKIKYGAVHGGSTLSFFRSSNFSTYQRMWAAMESARPSVFTKSNDEGRDRVMKGRGLYAFLMESTSLEYITERYCELTQIGGLLDSKGYGIAMPVNSPYRTAISGAVLKMQEEGKLHQLKTRWWKEMYGGGRCDEQATTSAGDSAAELGIDNVGGVFVVLALGCFCSFIIGILEFLWNVRKVAVEEKVTPMEALQAELKFALNLFITTKPVHNMLSEASSAKSSLRSKSESRRESESVGRMHNIKTGNSLMNVDVCTAYETNQDPKQNSSSEVTTESEKSKKEPSLTKPGLDSPASKPDNSVISAVLGGLFQSTNMLMSKTPKPIKSDPPTNLPFEPIKYSYADYANVDHRLKLYLYQNLFEDTNETLKWLVSCVIFDENQLDKWPTGFDGLFIMSTTKFYVMKKIASENHDPSSWMKKHLSGTIDRVGIAQVLPWKIGMKFFISAVGGMHIILQDILRTDCLILFFADNPLPEYCTFDYQPSELLTNKLGKATGGEMVKILMVINFCEVLSDDVLQSLQLCTLLLTDSQLYLAPDIKWLNENSKYQIEPKYTQLMSNLIELEDIHSLSCRLNFIDEKEDKYETWRIDFATVTAKESVVSTICNSWQKIFGVPLINSSGNSSSNNNHSSIVSNTSQVNDSNIIENITN